MVFRTDEQHVCQSYSFISGFQTIICLISSYTCWCSPLCALCTLHCPHNTPPAAVNCGWTSQQARTWFSTIHPASCFIISVRLSFSCGKSVHRVHAAKTCQQSFTHRAAIELMLSQACLWITNKRTVASNRRSVDPNSLSLVSLLCCNQLKHSLIH